MIQHGYSATQNNGQITQAVDNVSGETIAYQYDALRRLTSAASTPNAGTTPTAWTQTFQYDGFGNLTAKVLNGTTTPIPVNAATNQLSSAYYDANGNMTSGAGATLAYDVANRVSSATEVSGGTEYYYYSPDNKRIYRLKADGITEGWTFYGARGERLGVYSLGLSGGFTPLRTNVAFAGTLILDGNSAAFGDRTGSNRASGGRFYPYGDEITSTANDREKFGTYLRDGFTGLDYADRRFYASTYGRFNTADQYQASGGPSDPGSWNRYTYTRGDPVNRFDPTGRVDIATCGGDGDDSGGCFGGGGGWDYWGNYGGCGSQLDPDPFFSFGHLLCDQPDQGGQPVGGGGGGAAPPAPAPAPTCQSADPVSASYGTDETLELDVLF
jgi:RHS repeat-associated protein